MDWSVSRARLSDIFKMPVGYHESHEQDKGNGDVSSNPPIPIEVLVGDQVVVQYSTLDQDQQKTADPRGELVHGLTHLDTHIGHSGTSKQSLITYLGRFL